MDHMYIWLIAGILLMALEALGMPGVGLMFAGLGAIVVGVLISLNILVADAYIPQFIIFFVSTAIWTMLLWKPMQRFRLRNGKQAYNNIVGETAYVGSSGLGAKGGEVTWSGTIMNAKLEDGVSASLEAGAQVVIVDISGSTLIVKPKA